MNQSQIFISYSHDNQKFAYKLYDDLLSARYWVWIDRRLEPAKEWEPQIDENLRKSKTLIVLISSASVKSDWVKHEGSMCFALNQSIIPVKIEQFGTYKAADLPIWAKKIQLLDLIEGSTEYDDQFQELKQRLGDPLPIQQHLEEILVHYQSSGMLLDEVALALIERHYHEICLPKDKKELADKLIEESKRKLDSYWVRYDKLKNDYENSQKSVADLNKKNQSLMSERTSLNEKYLSLISDVRFQIGFVVFLYIIFCSFLFFILSIVLFFR